MELLVKGKVKEVYEIDDTQLRFRFTDQISVFDKVIPSLIPRKGESLCRTSSHWFQIAEKMLIPSHFMKARVFSEPHGVRVKKIGAGSSPRSWQ